MVPLQIVTVVAGLLVMLAKQFYPGFPFDEAQIASFIVFLLGLFGVVVSFRARGVLDMNGGDVILKSKAFWIMVAALLNFVVHAFLPDFPLLEADLAAVIFWILAAVGINPELRARGLLK